MRAWVTVTMICVGLLATPVGKAQTKPSPEHKIARAAAVVATNRLAADVKDKTGLLLLHLARQLNPNDETALLTAALLERETAPDPLKTSGTDDKLAEMLVKRAEFLWGKHFEKNAKVGPLCLLYLKVAERFRPGDRTILLGQMKLRVRGCDGKLDELLASDLDLKDMFDQPTPPTPLAKPKLEKVDRDIAKYAAVIGTNRLAADPKDATGRMLVQLAGCLEPENSTVLLTLARIERGQKIEPIKTEVAQEKLVSVIAGRANRLLDTALKAKGAVAALCLLYHRVAERFQPDDKTVILGLMKLKMAGVEGELSDLLAEPREIGVGQPKTAETTNKTKRPPEKKATVRDGLNKREWLVSCWMSAWRSFPLSKMTTSFTGGRLKATNTTRVHSHARLIHAFVLTGDFEIEADVRGGYKIGITPLRAADGEIYLNVPDQSRRHRLRIQRQGGRLRFWRNGKQEEPRYYKMKADEPCGFTIILKNGQQCEIRKFRLEAAEPQAFGAIGNPVTEIQLRARRKEQHTTLVWQLLPGFARPGRYRLSVQHAASGPEGAFRLVAWTDTDNDGLPDKLVGQSDTLTAKKAGEWSKWEFTARTSSIFVGNTWSTQRQIYYTEKPPRNFIGLGDTVFHTNDRSVTPTIRARPRFTNIRLEPLDGQ